MLNSNSIAVATVTITIPKGSDLGYEVVQPKARSYCRRHEWVQRYRDYSEGGNYITADTPFEMGWCPTPGASMRLVNRHVRQGILEIVGKTPAGTVYIPADSPKDAVIYQLFHKPTLAELYENSTERLEDLAIDRCPVAAASGASRLVVLADKSGNNSRVALRTEPEIVQVTSLTSKNERYSPIPSTPKNSQIPKTDFRASVKKSYKICNCPKGYRCTKCRPVKQCIGRKLGYGVVGESCLTLLPGQSCKDSFPVADARHFDSLDPMPDLPMLAHCLWFQTTSQAPDNVSEHRNKAVRGKVKVNGITVSYARYPGGSVVVTPRMTNHPIPADGVPYFKQQIRNALPFPTPESSAWINCGADLHYDSPTSEPGRRYGAFHDSGVQLQIYNKLIQGQRVVRFEARLLGLRANDEQFRIEVEKTRRQLLRLIGKGASLKVQTGNTGVCTG